MLVTSGISIYANAGYVSGWWAVVAATAAALRQR